MLADGEEDEEAVPGHPDEAHPLLHRFAEAWKLVLLPKRIYCAAVLLLLRCTAPRRPVQGLDVLGAVWILSRAPDMGFPRLL